MAHAVGWHSCWKYAGFSRVSSIIESIKLRADPILILFYYNNTPDNILSEFYEASRTDEKLEEGKIKDSMTNKRLKEEDLVFSQTYKELGKLLNTYIKDPSAIKTENHKS